MNRLNKSVQINPTFSWTDWELYEGPFSSSTARSLNQHLMDLVNSGNDRRETEDAMHDLMLKLSKSGAYDTEPRDFLERILTEIFGD